MKYLFSRFVTRLNLRVDKTSLISLKPVVVHYCATFLKPEMLHIYRQIKGIKAFESVVFTQKRENKEMFPWEHLRVLPKPCTHFLRRFWVKQICGKPIQIYPSEARRIAEALEVAEAKLIHIYFGHIGVHLLPYIRNSKIPVVVSFHGADVMVDMEKPTHRGPMEEMIRRVDRLLVRSESLARGLEQLGAPPEKIRLHRTGIPLEELTYQERKIPAEGGWRWVQACRLIQKKGLETSLRAFAVFAQKYPSAVFTIAGEGPLREALEGLCAELGVRDRVRFTGFLSQEKLRELYYASHFFVHPSEIGSDGNQEGVPNAMLEAMATGLPVLATLHGGIPEAVENGQSGYLGPEKDYEFLAEAALKIAGDESEYRRLAQNASEAVKAKFDLNRQVEILEGYYRELI